MAEEEEDILQPFAPDSPVEGIVSSEPVSVSVFPADRERYREL